MEKTTLIRLVPDVLLIEVVIPDDEDGHARTDISPRVPISVEVGPKKWKIALKKHVYLVRSRGVAKKRFFFPPPPERKTLDERFELCKL